MSIYQSLPPTYEQAIPILQRALQESAAAVLPTVSIRRRPDPPRSLISQPGSLESLITWNAPAKSDDVAGWRIYKDNEGNHIDTVMDPASRQYRAKLPGNTPTAFYVSSINAAGRESIKVQVIASANTDQLVSSGGTSGTSPGLPPGYGGEPSGGGRGNQELREF